MKTHWRKASLIFTLIGFFFCLAFKKFDNNFYLQLYTNDINFLINALDSTKRTINNNDPNSYYGNQTILNQIHKARIQLKNTDFWIRYFDPVLYNKINGQLAIEWENEVFEKFETPYKREGGGLSLAEVNLREHPTNKDSLVKLIHKAFETCTAFLSDSFTIFLNSHDHFFLANRLFLLNLATIYNTGFECPDKTLVLEELQSMLLHAKEIYTSYNRTFLNFKIQDTYLSLFENLLNYVTLNKSSFENFNHFIYIRDFINPLFKYNQEMIRNYQVVSKSFNDYSLNNKAQSIFDKMLYEGQDQKGIYRGIMEESQIAEIMETGKLLFYDPILSKNNQRSCASCHIPKQFFTDTTVQTSRQFDRIRNLPRNTPTLLNVGSNHLVMLDGKHYNLTNQLRDVISNPIELASSESEVLKKVLSCKLYRSNFKKFAHWTGSKDIRFDHIASAIIIYYSHFSQYDSPFDKAIHHESALDGNTVDGFNLFMGKATCGTCHFVPFFNGVKPPYISSEFEVIAVPDSINSKNLSPDSGRAKVHLAKETMNAFRTSGLRNIIHTKPYMHNGVFKTLEEVIHFYDAGGGLGSGIFIENQTLSRDSLKLTANEKMKLIKFLESLTETIKFDVPPSFLPVSKNILLNKRKVGGEY